MKETFFFVANNSRDRFPSPPKQNIINNVGQTRKGKGKCAFIIISGVLCLAFFTAARFDFLTGSTTMTTATMTTTTTKTIEKKRTTPTPYELVQEHAVETKKELSKLESRFGDRFVSWKRHVDDKNLTFQSLEEAVIPILQERGLVLVGDSTTRHLFGFLFCLLEGIFRNNDGNDQRKKQCSIVQARLKEECVAVPHQCGQIATFSNPKYNGTLHLEFRPGNFLKSLEQETYNALKNHSLNPNIQRVVYIGMPCLHSLWTPGSREGNALKYSDWPAMFTHFYEQVEESIGNSPSSTSRVLVGMSNSLCDSKLGDGKRIIDTYLKEIPISGKKSRRDKKLIRFYNYNLPKSDRLPYDYTGIIPTYRSFRANHTSEDFAMFHDDGSMECSKIGTEMLFNDRVMPNNSFVLDMRSATTSACANTDDGRHYKGVVLMRQTALIVKGANQGFRSIV